MRGAYTFLHLERNFTERSDGMLSSSILLIIAFENWDDYDRCNIYMK